VVCYTTKHKIPFEIDDEDYEFVLKHTWSISKGYVATSINGHTTYLHRKLLNPPVGMVVDHKNGDKCNNKRSNLRICTQKENSQNQRRKKITSSIYQGVYYSKSTNKWRSRIMENGKGVHLGCFENEIDAAIAYDKNAIRIYGEGVKLNVLKYGYTDVEPESDVVKKEELKSILYGLINDALDQTESYSEKIKLIQFEMSILACIDG
jgi:hypothetical protein